MSDWMPIIVPSSVTDDEAKRLDALIARGAFKGMENACLEFAGGTFSTHDEHGSLCVPVMQILKRLP